MVGAMVCSVVILFIMYCYVRIKIWFLTSCIIILGKKRLPRRWESLILVKWIGAASAVSQAICSDQYVIHQNLLHFFGFFKNGAVSRLLKCVKSFYGRLDLFKIVLCQSIVDSVIVYAVKEIDGKIQLCH